MNLYHLRSCCSPWNAQSRGEQHKPTPSSSLNRHGISVNPKTLY
jgi:hypothetical protein